MVNAFLDERPIYTVDGSDRIVFANAAWLEYTRQPQTIVGRPVWEWLGQGQVRQLWEVLYARVRGSAAQLFVPMRADTAIERRVIDIELRPLEERSVLHICEPVWSEARSRVRLLDAREPRDERELRCCAWCKRIQVRIGVWEEIEEAQAVLGVEARATVPTLAQAVCSGCKQSVLKTFPATAA